MNAIRSYQKLNPVFHKGFMIGLMITVPEDTCLTDLIKKLSFIGPVSVDRVNYTYDAEVLIKYEGLNVSYVYKCEEFNKFLEQ
jgi:hypothetical protein